MNPFVTRQSYYRHLTPDNKAILIWPLLMLLMLGCANTSPPCDANYHLSWSNQQRLMQDIHILSSPAHGGRKTGSPGAALSRAYITGQMQQAGLTPWQGHFDHDFNYDYQFGQRRGTNVIGMLAATKPSDSWRIVVAHYDHLGQRGSTLYAGADDNASGVAAMLEIARHAAQQDRSSHVLFVATDAEEPGLFGAKALVAQFQQTQSQPQASQIQLMINLDMLGRPGRRDTIYLEGRRGFRHFVQLKQQLQQSVDLCIRANHPPQAGKTLQRVDWLRASDHYPFHQADIPWLYFGVPPHQDYHQPTDVVEKIDSNFLAAVTETAYELLIIDSYLLDKQYKP